MCLLKREPAFNQSDDCKSREFLCDWTGYNGVMTTLIIYQDYEVSQNRPTVKRLVTHFCFWILLLQHIGFDIKLNYEGKNLAYIFKLMVFTSTELLLILTNFSGPKVIWQIKVYFNKSIIFNWVWRLVLGSLQFDKIIFYHMKIHIIFIFWSCTCKSIFRSHDKKKTFPWQIHPLIKSMIYGWKLWKVSGPYDIIFNIWLVAHSLQAVTVWRLQLLVSSIKIKIKSLRAFGLLCLKSGLQQVKHMISWMEVS